MMSKQAGSFHSMLPGLTMMANKLQKFNDKGLFHNDIKLNNIVIKGGKFQLIDVSKVSETVPMYPDMKFPYPPEYYNLLVYNTPTKQKRLELYMKQFDNNVRHMWISKSDYGQIERFMKVREKVLKSAKTFFMKKEKRSKYAASSMPDESAGIDSYRLGHVLFTCYIMAPDTPIKDKEIMKLFTIIHPSKDLRRNVANVLAEFKDN
jgi:hypothetical protein